MAKCSGCSGECVCSLTVMDTATLNLTITGNGSTSPWVLSGDVLGGGGGGGGVPDQHILIASNFINQSLDSGTPFAVPLDSANVLGAYVQRGTDITWAGANPTRLTINTTGVYDLAAGAGFVATSANLPVTVFAEIYVNGVTDIRGIVFSSQLLLNNVGAMQVQNNSSHGWAFTAGQYIELVVGASDSVAGPDAALLPYGALSVTRRV